MIKINLAPQRSGTPGAKSSSIGISTDVFVSPDEVRKEALKRILVILIPSLALYAYQEQNIPHKHAELAAKTQMYNELMTYNAKQSASVAEIKKFKEDEALIEARIAALDKISRDRHHEIRVLDLLQQVVPEKAWLTKVVISQDKVTIQGFAYSDFEVSSLLESLTKSVFLIDVNLVNSSESTVDGMSLRRFEINCLLEKPQ